MAKRLFLYTLMYPFGRREAYLEAEAQILSATFDEVIVLPFDSNPEFIVGEKRSMPHNFKMYDLYGESSSYVGSKKDRFKVFATAKWKLNFLKDFRYQLSYSGEIARKKDILKQFHQTQEEGLHYSYWMNDWSTVLSFLCAEGALKSFFTRAHGFDLYEEREKLGYQPWRKFQLKHLNKVYTVSDAGRKYLGAKYPVHNSKVETSYLGTADYGQSVGEKTDAYQLVSCSAIIPLKRVERLLEVMAHMTDKIHWTHIGFGVDIEGLRRKAKLLPENIKVTFTGSKGHEDVMDFYKKNHLDCFLNISTTEGLPVAMMEAISFGIPIFATDVGGVKEM